MLKASNTLSFIHLEENETPQFFKIKTKQPQCGLHNAILVSQLLLLIFGGS